MWSWLRKLFGPERPSPPAQEPPWLLDLRERIERIDDRIAAEPAELTEAPRQPAWAGDLAELLQRSARAQSKSALRLEDLERKIEGGFTELQQRLQRAAAAPGSAELGFEEVLDAMDLLDEARAAAEASMAAGLLGVQQRLQRHLQQAGVRRVGPAEVLGAQPDGALVRVAGTEDRPELPQGAVTRVIRSAAQRGDRLLREGLVLTNRRDA